MSTATQNYRVLNELTMVTMQAHGIHHELATLRQDRVSDSLAARHERYGTLLLIAAGLLTVVSVFPSESLWRPAVIALCIASATLVVCGELRRHWAGNGNRDRDEQHLRHLQQRAEDLDAFGALHQGYRECVLLRAATDAAKEDGGYGRFVEHWHATVKQRLAWLRYQLESATDERRRQAIIADISESEACLKDLGLE